MQALLGRLRGGAPGRSGGGSGTTSADASSAAGDGGEGAATITPCMPPGHTHFAALQYTLPGVPSHSYGNGLASGERPGRVAARASALLVGRPPPDGRHGQTARARARGTTTTTTTTAQPCRKMHTPLVVDLPREWARTVVLDPGQVHALHVGVGLRSIEDRWQGRLYFREDGSAVLPLWRTWVPNLIYELTFDPLPPDSLSPSSSSSSSSSSVDEKARPTMPSSSSRVQKPRPPPNPKAIHPRPIPTHDSKRDPGPAEYTDADPSLLPPAFPTLVLSGLRTELNPALFRPHRPWLQSPSSQSAARSGSGSGTRSREGEREGPLFVLHPDVEAELKSALGVVGTLLRMRAEMGAILEPVRDADAGGDEKEG